MKQKNLQSIGQGAELDANEKDGMATSLAVLDIQESSKQIL